ncbi:MAG: DUF58 domain-containing protein [Planctomycetaceae bacterium]
MSRSPEYLNPDILSQIVGIGLKSRQLVEGLIAGQHRSPLQGLSPEFVDYRDYTPGDDLKNLDWRIYGRSDRFYIKRYEEESNLRAYIMLDASASMGYGGEGRTKFNTAATIAASLAAVFLKQRDSVGLTLFDEQGRQELPLSAVPSQLYKLAEVLQNAEPGGKTEMGPVLATLADRIRRRAVTVLISDFFTPIEPLYAAIGKLQYSGHEIIVIHVLHQDELDLPFRESVIFRDIEGADEFFAEPWTFQSAYREAMQQFIGELKERCQFCGIDYLQILTEDDLGSRLSHYLFERQKQGSVKRHGRMSNLGGGQ